MKRRKFLLSLAALAAAMYETQKEWFVSLTRRLRALRVATPGLEVSAEFEPGPGQPRVIELQGLVMVGHVGALATVTAEATVMPPMIGYPRPGGG
jgi:hypothetical protein